MDETGQRRLWSRWLTRGTLIPLISFFRCIVKRHFSLGLLSPSCFLTLPYRCGEHVKEHAGTEAQPPNGQLLELRGDGEGRCKGAASTTGVVEKTPDDEDL